MKNKEKAQELAQKYFPDEYNIWARNNIEAVKTEYACIEMANFIIDKAIKYLELNMQCGVHPQGIQGFIKQFQQVMEE